jgi:hypothetical protein
MIPSMLLSVVAIAAAVVMDFSAMKQRYERVHPVAPKVDGLDFEGFLTMARRREPQGLQELFS